MPRYIQGQIDWPQFRRDLRRYQQKESVTGKELARRLHISGAALTRYLNGERTPTAEVFVYALLLMHRNLNNYVLGDPGRTLAPHRPSQQLGVCADSGAQFH